MIKQHLEAQGWKAWSAVTAGQSVIYKFSNRRKELQVELCADGRTKVTYDNDTRVVPNRADIAKALNKKEASDIDVIRIFDQVLNTLIDRHRDATTADISDSFGRFSRYRH